MWPDTSPIVRAFEDLTAAAWRVIVLLAAALVLALVALPAVAQPKCWPQTSQSQPLQIVRADSGEPVKEGQVVYAASLVGLVYGWHCTDSSGVWRRQIIGGPWSAFVPHWLTIADSLWRGTDADRSAAWAQYVTAPSIDSRLAGDVERLAALMPPPSWVVARFGTYTTRPTYPVVDGVRGTTSNGRVDIGSPCDCAKTRILSGSATYCSVLGRADTVAVCTRR